MSNQLEKIKELIERRATARMALVVSGTISFFGKIIVSEPLQKCSARVSARGGISFTEFFSISRSQMWIISGLSCGLPLALNIFAHASGLYASAARPYTVSVGIATTSPFFISSAASHNTS